VDSRLTIQMAAMLWSMVSVSTAMAQADYNLCVFPDGIQAPDGCGELCSGDPVESVSEALLLAEGLPNGPDDNRPWVRICLDSIAPHVESIDIDNADGRYGAPLVLFSTPAGLCPDPGTPASQAVITWSSPSSPPPGRPPDQITELVLDLRSEDQEGSPGPCPDPRPGIRVQGTGDIHIHQVRMAGTSGFGIGNGLAGPPSTLVAANTSILDCSGAAIRTAGPASVGTMDVVGCRLPAESEAQAVVEVLPGGTLILTSSVLFGNVVEASPSEDQRAVILGAARLDRVGVIANVVPENHSVLRLGFLGPELHVMTDELLATQPTAGIANSIVSRNQHVVDGSSIHLAASGWDPLTPGFGVCAGASDVPWGLRPSPAEGAGSAAGPLVTFDGAVAHDEDGEGRIVGSWLVDNDLADSPVIESQSSSPLLSLDISQNTFGGNGDGPLLSVAEIGIGQSVYVARNLRADGQAAAQSALVVAKEAPTSLVVTMNAAPKGWEPYRGPESSHQLTGPQVSFPTFDPTDPVVLSALGHCELFLLSCPDAGSADCSTWGPEELVCPIDTALSWLPSESFSDSLGTAWPWDTDFYERHGDSETVAGATGAACLSWRAPRDEWDLWGDGDWFPDSVDCDNEDAAVWPVVPSLDGYSSTWCESSDADCYSCPDGSSPPPDDDDSSAPSDDDDSSLDDDDEWPSGSGGFDCDDGCGFSWGCSGSQPVLVVLPFLWLGRRERGRRGSGA
jgi:hypothetical protein